MAAVEAVRVATWKVAYRGLLPDELLDRLKVTEVGVAKWNDMLVKGEVATVVAVDDKAVVGFASCGRCRDADLPDARELWAVYVLPAYWATGTGARLLAAAGDIDVVWVLQGNERAIAFYERQGFRADGTAKVLDHIGGATDVRYVRP